VGGGWVGGQRGKAVQFQGSSSARHSSTSRVGKRKEHKQKKGKWGGEGNRETKGEEIESEGCKSVWKGHIEGKMVEQYAQVIIQR